jgi:predicted N-acetyltransferase YhbS
VPDPAGDSRATVAGMTPTPDPRPVGSPAPEPLGEGLVLRSAEPADVEAIVTLETAAFGDSDGPGVRAHLSTPEALADWLVVTAPSSGPEPRLVAASGLLAHTMVLDGVAFPAGQIEYVVTDPAFQRRGLVRAQFARHHRRAAERGDLALFITGIPYLYRRFGYGYGLDYPPIRIPVREADGSADPAAEVPTNAARSSGTGADPRLAVRPARDADLATIRRLDADRPPSGLRVQRDDAAWQVATTTCADNRYEQLWVLERVDPGLRVTAVVGWFRTQRRPEDERLYIPTAGIEPGEPASSTMAMIRHAETIAGDDTLIVWDIPDTSYSGHLDDLARLGALSEPMQLGQGIYVRVPDPVALLDRLRPLLSARLAGTKYAERDDELVLSLYESGVALDLARGEVTAVRAVPGIEDPFAVGGVGIAPDWFGALVFGRHGAIALEARADDVTLGRRRGVMEVLFPKRPSDVVGDL